MSLTPQPPSARPAATVLAELLEALGRPAPAWGSLEERAPEQLPQPQRDLLVHPRDMTRTLERHLGCELDLVCLARRQHGDTLLRQVILRDRIQPGTTAEAGAIRIHLDNLPSAAREQVLAEKLPLGGILHAHAVEHVGDPQGFFVCSASVELAELLGARPHANLYGRVSRLQSVRDDQVLAEAIEILPAFE